MRHAFLLAAVLLALGAPEASAVQYEVVLTYPEAVQMVRASGGAVKHCRRVAVERFRCRAVYWLEGGEAEVAEDGSLFNERTIWFRVPADCMVTFAGVRIVYHYPEGVAPQ